MQNNFPVSEIHFGERKLHVHLLAMGDSLTEGLSRVTGSTKIFLSPYVKALSSKLINAICSNGDRVQSVTSQVFAFRGRTSGMLVDEISSILFVNSSNRIDPFAIPADLHSILVDSTDVLGPHRVVIVCAVMAGSNDVLRAEGSRVGRALTVITLEETLSKVTAIHELCTDYARAVVHRSRSQLPVTIQLLPMGIPPMMLDPQTQTMRFVASRLEGKRNAVRAQYGYCFTSPSSWHAMNTQRLKIRDALVSPGHFFEGLELLVERKNEIDRAFPERLRSSVCQEAVDSDPFLVDNTTLWSDCIHLTPTGYDLLGEVVAGVLIRQLA